MSKKKCVTLCVITYSLYLASSMLVYQLLGWKFLTTYVGLSSLGMLFYAAFIDRKIPFKKPLKTGFFIQLVLCLLVITMIFSQGEELVANIGRLM